MEFEIVHAEVADGEEMLALMPRLADFDVPESRDPEHLWRDDAALLKRWLNNEEDCLVLAAKSSDRRVLGFTLTRLRPEALSHAPSAHLEAIAVDQSAEGRGVAKALLLATEEYARKNGAESLTLHVISSNSRARAFYERAGYFGELVRYIKPI